jgi:hypothetical protein
MHSMLGGDHNLPDNTCIQCPLSVLLQPWTYRKKYVGVVGKDKQELGVYAGAHVCRFAELAWRHPAAGAGALHKEGCRQDRAGRVGIQPSGLMLLLEIQTRM